MNFGENFFERMAKVLVVTAITMTAKEILDATDSTSAIKSLFGNE